MPPDKPPFRGCENPQKRSSTFPIKLPRSTGSIATQFQSHLELLVRQGWFKAALRRDAILTPADRANLARWVPAVAPRITAVGLFGPVEE